MVESFNALSPEEGMTSMSWPDSFWSRNSYVCFSTSLRSTRPGSFCFSVIIWLKMRAFLF